MLKREITFTNFDNVEETETHCFHLSKAELIQMEVEYPDGITDHLTKVSESKDGKLIIGTMKDLILRSYGIREGNRFRKNAQIREEFESSEAFSELFMELATNAESAAAFVVGIMPVNLEADLDKIMTVAPIETPATIKSITRAEMIAMGTTELNTFLASGGRVEADE